LARVSRNPRCTDVKDLTLTRKWVEKGEKTEMKEITGESIAVKSMWAQFDQLTISFTCFW
jgi:hypothetical protein